MRKLNFLVAPAILAAVALTGPNFASGDEGAAEKPAATKADNTKMNKLEKGLTADQQKMNKADAETTRNIRRAVMKDKSLSTYGHNVKIITRDGMVTLKGPVRSEEERQAVEKAALTVVGKEKVKNELSIAPKSKEKK